MSVEEWRLFAKRASFHAARRKAKSLGVNIIWDCEHAKTPEGYYQVRDGIEWAVAKSLAAAPFADILWMESATANLHDARAFAVAIHAEFPDKMLAYNLSPSFNWDSTGMSDDDMRRFPEELGTMGFVFNFKVNTEVGQIIVANVNQERIAELLEADRVQLGKLIRKEA